MCINVVRVFIELIVQYYNILDGTQYMFIPLSLDESLVQQNLQVFLQQTTVQLYILSPYPSVPLTQPAVMLDHTLQAKSDPKSQQAVGAKVVSEAEELQVRVGQQSGKLRAELDVSKQLSVSGFSPDFNEGQLYLRTNFLSVPCQHLFLSQEPVDVGHVASCPTTAPLLSVQSDVRDIDCLTAIVGFVV